MKMELKQTKLYLDEISNQIRNAVYPAKLL